MNTFFLKEPYKLLVVCIAGVFLFCIASCSQEEKPVKATDQNAASKK